ncbi:hypothetical protein [Metarhizobium album]|uniref:hypothetical protein n=1 Tax=Metarhizobium album TaxID=2182425 RepID=UPI000FFF41F6|nr:hypothetical protein [Rhizobium album]
MSHALQRYDEAMRPIVEEGQDVPKIAPKMLQPQTRIAVALQHAVLRVAAAPGIRQFATKLFTPRTKEIVVPHYRSSPEH